MFQSLKYSGFYFCQTLINTHSYFLIAYAYLHWQCSDTIRSMYYIILWSIISKFSKSRTYIYFNTFSHTFTDLNIVLTTHILLNVICKVITCHTYRVIANDSSQRDNSNLCRTTTYIYNHITLWSLYVNTTTYCSSHWFKD